MARGRVIHKRGFKMLHRIISIITFVLTLLVLNTTAHADDSIEVLIKQIDPIVAAIDAHEEPAALPVKTSKTLTGRASYYGKNHHGRRTASGQRFNMWAMTAAHKSLPFGTCLAVTNTATDQQVIVKITDRGPYHGNRVLDLSQGAAGKIGMIKTGVATIKYAQVSCSA